MEQLVTTGTETVALQTLTAPELLQIYKPQSIKALTYRIKTPADLFKPENNTPCFAYIAKRMKNPDLALALLRLHLVDLLDFINPSRNMTMAQVDATAELILMEYSTMTITDLIFVIKRAKLGGFGNLYEGIDGQKILGWISAVMMERDDAAAQQSQLQHEKMKAEMDRIFGTERRSIPVTVRDEMNAAQQNKNQGKADHENELRDYKDKMET